MIYRLRQQHRRIVIALSLFLPVTFVVGISARRPVPVDPDVSVSSSAPVSAFKLVVWERPTLFAKSPVEVRLVQAPALAGLVALELSTTGDFVQPDLMVYWVAGNPKLTDALPDQAILLGSFSSKIFPVRDEWRQATGVIVLYSLADGAIVDVSQPVQLGDSPK